MSLPNLPSNEDFAFFMGENVAVGGISATVIGQATHAYKEDSFELEYPDDDGFIVARWFQQHVISKTRKQ